jgi:hypothetical protein
LPLTHNNAIVSKNNISQFGLSFIVIFVFIGFRGFISTDYTSYFPFFNNVTTFNGTNFLDAFTQRNGWEAGFVFYTMLFKTLCSDYFLYQASLLCFDVIVLHKVFSMYCKGYERLAFCFFFVFQGFGIEVNLLRNSKSIMLFLLSLEYIKKNNFIKYTFINLIGFLFHTSALLYIPLFFVLKRKYTRTFLISLFVIGQIFFLAQIPWERILFLKIAEFVPGRFNSYIAMYITKLAKGYGFSIGYLERSFSSILILLLYSKLERESENSMIFINIFFVYQLIFLYFSGLAIIPQRVGLLFIPGYWFVYPIVYSLLKRDMKIFFLLCLLFYSIFRMYMDTNTILLAYDNYLLNPLNFQSFVERKRAFLQNFQF